MSVQTQPFRVVGVNTQTGEDVSVVIDAATKAAAEVKAEQMDIETTHIVRLKQDTSTPPDEHELFSSEAAEALAGKRTDKLIEEVVPPEEPKAATASVPSSAATSNTHTQTQAPQPPNPIVAAITRPSYNAPASRQEPSAAEVSGLRAFGLVLIVLFGISAGAYFVLVHQPNRTVAQDAELVFGQDLFSDVLQPPALEAPFDKLDRDAFNDTSADHARSAADGPPIAPDQQLQISRAEPASANGSNSAAASATQPRAITPASSTASKFKLQSVVTTNKGRFAVINGKLYEQGGAIGSAKLVRVADDWVLIERDGKQFTLQIESK
jgi:hypothetical protein